VHWLFAGLLSTPVPASARPSIASVVNAASHTLMSPAVRSVYADTFLCTVTVDVEGWSWPVYWTLFGPYARYRQGPRRTGLIRRINDLRINRLAGTREKPLEVLAGAISWGFKSPSPHHFQNKGFRWSSATRTFNIAEVDLNPF